MILPHKVLPNTFTIDPSRKEDAHNCLSALAYLRENDAVPEGWKPSRRSQHSFDWLEETGDDEMAAVVVWLKALFKDSQQI
jgi:hypothetical protein